MTEVRAEMVANVLRVVATVGDEVVEGDVLLVLESMKMEIPVLAEATGRLDALTVEQGAVVHEGELLAVIVES